IADVAGLASSGAAVVKLVAGAMRALAPDHVGTTLGRFFDVLEKDLGLDHATVAAAFDGSLDRIVSGLQGGAGDGVALGAAIQQLRRAGADVPPLPAIGKDSLLPPLISALRSTGIPAVAGRLADQLDRVADVVGPLAAVDSLAASASVSSPHGPKALPKDPPGDGTGTDTTSSPGPTPGTGPNMAWYATWYTGQKQTTSVDPAGHPLLAEVKFGQTLTPTVMEGIAFHSRWIADLIEAFLHAGSQECDDV